jgi:copper chaperone CopZ
MVQEERLTLPKIGCQGCMKKVVNALNTVSNLEIVQTDVPTKTLVVRYEDDAAGMKEIEAALKGIGHTTILRNEAQVTV